MTTNKCYSKEFLSLLTNIVTEICDDSDDEDLLPLKVAAEYISSKRKKVCHSESAPKNVNEAILSETTISDDCHRSSLPEYTRKYITLSSFESKSIVRYPKLLKKGSICFHTLKTRGDCICDEHRQEPRKYYVQNIFATTILDVDFDTFWKMKKSTLEIVYNLILNSDAVASGTPLTSAGFLAVLYSLTSGERQDNVIAKFGISEDDYNLQERVILDAVLEMRFKFEQWPQARTAAFISQEFEKLGGLAGVIGAVAFVHFQCDARSNFHLNNNGDKTIVFQLVCNHRGSFMFSSYFWWPGRFSNVKINEMSALASYSMPPSTYLVGDISCAPIKEIVTPYLNPQESRTVLFNKLHAACFRPLSTAVSRLVSRFSTLRRLNCSFNPWQIRKKFNSCLLLHNMCLELNDAASDDSTFEINQFFPKHQGHVAPAAENDLREMLCSSIDVQLRPDVLT